MVDYPQHRRPASGAWDSEKVQALRRHLRLSQAELADRLGTRQQTISEWERGGLPTPRHQPIDAVPHR